MSRTRSRQPEIQAQPINTQPITIANDNHCLFWAITLSALMPKLANHREFHQTFIRLMGRENIDSEEIAKTALSQLRLHGGQPSDFRKARMLNPLVTEELRGRIADYLLNPDNQALLLRENANDCTLTAPELTARSQAIRNPNTWGGLPEILAASHMLQTCIQLKFAAEGQPIRSINPDYKSTIAIVCPNMAELNDNQASSHYRVNIDGADNLRQQLKAIEQSKLYDEWGIAFSTVGFILAIGYSVPDLVKAAKLYADPNRGTLKDTDEYIASGIQIGMIGAAMFVTIALNSLARHNTYLTSKNDARDLQSEDYLTKAQVKHILYLSDWIRGAIGAGNSLAILLVLAYFILAITDIVLESQKDYKTGAGFGIAAQTCLIASTLLWGITDALTHILQAGLYNHSIKPQMERAILAKSSIFSAARQAQPGNHSSRVGDAEQIAPENPPALQ